MFMSQSLECSLRLRGVDILGREFGGEGGQRETAEADDHIIPLSGQVLA